MKTPKLKLTSRFIATLSQRSRSILTNLFGGRRITLWELYLLMEDPKIQAHTFVVAKLTSLAQKMMVK